MTPLLETIIGIIFIFLIFSLITSWIVEYCSMRLSRRGKMLRQFVFTSLYDPFNTSWGPQIYAHPLIDTLHRYVSRPGGLLKYIRNMKLGEQRHLPAYIPSDQFARAFVDVVRQHGTLPLFVKKEESGKYEVADPTIIGIRDAQNNLTGDTPASAFQEFIAKINNLKPSDTKTILASIAREIDPVSPQAMKAMEAGIANWYEGSMDRLSGWYKRSTRPWLFAIGLLVAIGFNVDTMLVTSRLYADPQLRSSVNRAADDFLVQNQTLPGGSSDGSLDTLKQKITELRASLDPLRLPIGWGKAMDTIQVQQPIPSNSRYWIVRAGANSLKQLQYFWSLYVVRPVSLAWRALPEHWIGWLLTAFALSFGANFWFDMLKRLVNMRSQGIKPETEVKTA